MELVYLWVEDYKNIKEQGFNFSPKFTCDYDKDSNELTINKNDNYIENFFGDNINVTAIVGKNGSGKSTVFRNIAWSSILVSSNNELLSLGFHGNNFKSIKSTIFQKSILYMNSDSMHPYEFDCGACDAVYPSNDNLYKLIENSGNLKNNFNSEDFYNNFQKLIIKHTNIFATNIFFYRPNYIRIYIRRKKNLQWEEEVHKILKDEDIQERKSFISFLKNYENIDILIDDFKVYSDKYKDCFNVLFMENLSIDIFDKLGRKYFDLSQGERKVFTELLMIYDAIYSHEYDNLILLLDEPDLTLHPDWQKRYINELLSILKLIDKNIHIIMTTHSPFLLSDIPKQNIIFLDKDEKGNCKVVNGLKDKKQTFGANIHTLLSDSFFMEDGLMGEFAKGKIDKAIEYLNKDKLSDKELKYCEQIISIIGEPIVKNQLQRMLDSKRLKKIDKIDRMEKDILDLQKKIEELKND